VVDARFCPRCGGPLSGPPPTRCASCGYELFVNPRPSGGVVVVESGRFLALRRAAEPRKGEWELPGGFCDGFEHPAEAAVREAREELGVDVELGPFVGMYLGDYEYQGENLPVLDCFWLAWLLDKSVTLNKRESLEYLWLPLSNPPQLGFRSMDQAVRAAAILHTG